MIPIEYFFSSLMVFAITDIVLLLFFHSYLQMIDPQFIISQHMQLL